MGRTQVFLQPGRGYQAASVEATGYGAYYRFTRYDTYSMQGNAPTRAPDVAAKSQDSSIACGSSFTPSIVTGSNSNQYEMSWNNNSSWEALGAYTPAGPGAYTFYVRNKYIDDESDTTQAGPYTLTVSSLAQASVTSANDTINYLESFTPTVSGSTGTGSYQMSWGNTSSWEVISPHAPTSAGSETFYVRRLASGCYDNSATSAAYTLTINKIDQAGVSSANDSISCGGSFTPSTSGGSGTGGWQMYWTDVGSWVTLASRTFSSSGDYFFKVRRVGDTNYNTSLESAIYTLSVSSTAQAAVSSAGGTINYLESFTPVASGGTGTGAYQMSWGDNVSWEALGAYTPATAGSETFYVRREPSGCYAASAAAGPYTLTIDRIAQAAITSASDTINCGEPFTPSTSGGSGTGEWQMYWSDTTTWETLASRTFSSTGSYDFWVMKVGTPTMYKPTRPSIR